MRRSSEPDEDQLGFSFGAPPPSPPLPVPPLIITEEDGAPASLRVQLQESAAPTFTGTPRIGALDLRKVWSVRELVASIRGSVERSFSDLWLEGEVSNYRPSESGHMYFTLKDGDAQLRIVMFRSVARLLRFRPENGMHIIARGRVTVYDARGELQVNAEYLEPKGAGALQVAFEQLKTKLAAEGLFDAGRKRSIPMLPRSIGIVTSPRGAAVQDILNILRRRHEDVHIIIYPAQVQGEYAALEVAAGVRHFSSTRSVDVIVVARGGGPIEDLAAFNDETLARTIAASQVPVISAVGHEIDFTIADFVADLRAPTPSAAAELVIEAKHALEQRTAELSERLRKSLRYRMLIARQQLDAVTRDAVFERTRSGIRRRQQFVDELHHRLASVLQRFLHQRRQRLDVAATRVRHHDVRRRLEMMQRSVEQRETRLIAIAQHQMAMAHSRLDRFTAQLQALSPNAILDRGYALAFSAEGKLLRSVDQTESGSEVRLRLADGEVDARVTARRKQQRR